MQNSSLPMLLDLAATPSYPPKSAISQKRPATTNPKLFSMGPTGRKSSLGATGTGRIQTGQPQQKRGYLQTATTSFYNPGAEDLKDSETFFCFTALKTHARPLKRLYTGPQHELLLKKRDNVKERYQRLYQSTNAEEGEVVAENADNLKELVLGAEQVLSSTYSVKYFGLKDNQLGIVSKRIPIATFDEKSYQHTRQQVLTSGKKSETATAQSKNTRMWTPNMRHSEPSPWRNSVMSSKCDEDLKSSSRPVTSPANNNAKPKVYKDATEQIQEEVAVSEKQEEENANAYLDIENVSKVNSAGRNSVTRFPETNMPPQPLSNEDKKHVITHYMIPRKLHSAKKPDSGKKIKVGLNSQWEVLGGIPDRAPYNNSLNEASDVLNQKLAEERNRMWVKVFPEDQRVSNTADFERKVMSLEKTKRTLLRSVDVEKAWEAKEPQSELDVPSRFRTHEVNKVLSDTSKYSYSQLLKTMYTNERPETALVENTQKMERIITAREEKKMQKPSKSLRGITSGKPGKPQKEYGGRYVIKVEYPKENKMLNQFIKIKTGVVNEQIEDA